MNISRSKNDGDYLIKKLILVSLLLITAYTPLVMVSEGQGRIDYYRNELWFVDKEGDATFKIVTNYSAGISDEVRKYILVDKKMLISDWIELYKAFIRDQFNLTGYEVKNLNVIVENLEKFGVPLTVRVEGSIPNVSIRWGNASNASWVINYHLSYPAVTSLIGEYNITFVLPKDANIVNASIQPETNNFVLEDTYKGSPSVVIRVPRLSSRRTYTIRISYRIGESGGINRNNRVLFFLAAIALIGAAGFLLFRRKF